MKKQFAVISIIATLSIFFLNISYEWLKHGSTSGQAVAILQERQNLVEKKPINRLIWLEVDAGQGFAQGDTLKTSAESSASLTFIKSGTQIALQENTEIVIEERDELDLTLLGGAVSVIKGQAKINGENVTKGESGSVTKDGRFEMTRIQTLSPDPNAKLEVSENGGVFSWQGVKSGSVVVLKLGYQDEPLKEVRRMTSDGSNGHFAVKVSEGKLRWQVQALEGDKQVGASAIMEATVSKPEAPQPLEAPLVWNASENVLEANEDGTLNLKWQTMEKAAKYEVAIIHRVLQVPRVYIVTDTEKILNHLKVGEYSLRLRTADSRGVLGEYSPEYTLRVPEPKRLSSPKLKYIKVE